MLSITKVKVTPHPETGEVFTLTEKCNENGVFYGYVRLAQRITSLEGNFLKTRTRSALLFMSEEDYELNKELLGVETELPGKIVLEETIDPPSWVNEDYILINRKTGDLITHQGLPIYRIYRYDPTGQLEDIILERDKVSSEEVVDKAKSPSKKTETAKSLDDELPI